MRSSAEAPRRPPVRVGARADGSLTYLVEVPPEALPAVRGRDLAAAWEAARAAADARNWGVARGFRFRREDGSFTDLALADADACCWAGAVDETVGMHTCYGLALCLRLLALVDLLTRAPWAAGRFAPGAGAAALHPALLRAAATAPLTADARFEELGFRIRLGPSGATAELAGGAGAAPHERRF
ncbi:MAG: hypothetical protein JO209_06600 [Acidisphaera sp.]|nr:hypothetical protein [Acidisphaera sp.]